MVSNFSLVVASGTVLLQIFSILLFFSLFVPNLLSAFARRHADKLALTVATIATLSSLFYSNIAGFTPCNLCWYQRILMYPQVLIMALAIWKRDTGWMKYIMTFSLIGASIALYNHYLQLGGNPLVPCGAGASCARRFIFEFGYISIPLMSFTAFVANALFAYSRIKKPAI